MKISYVSVEFEPLLSRLNVALDGATKEHQQVVDDCNAEVKGRKYSFFYDYSYEDFANSCRISHALDRVGTVKKTIRGVKLAMESNASVVTLSDEEVRLINRYNKG